MVQFENSLSNSSSSSSSCTTRIAASSSSMMLSSCTTKQQCMRTTDELPGEIMFDILSRLSVQTLCQCRFVSKYWYNLIKDPVFVDLHHSRIKKHESSSSGDISGGGLLVVCLTTPEIDQTFYVVNNDNIGTSLKALNIYFDLPREDTWCKIVGSSNGLLCLCSTPPISDCIYICNPVTREILKLPKALDVALDCETNNFEFLCTNSVGFAFHAPTKTYKVVRTWNFYPKGSLSIRSLRTGFEIYTVGSGIWKRIDQGNINIAPNNYSISQVYVNGALHWEMVDERNPNSEMRDCIGAIDLGEENFTTFGQPFCDLNIKMRSLSSLDQYLSIMDEFYDRVEIWIMKQYGVVGSWTREHVIRREMLGPLRTVSLNPFKTMKNGNILLHGGDYQGYYDLENHEFKQILIEGIKLPAYKLDIIANVGSLISPKSIAGIGEDYQVPCTIPRRQVKFKLKRKSSQLLASRHTKTVRFKLKTKSSKLLASRHTKTVRFKLKTKSSKLLTSQDTKTLFCKTLFDFP